MGRILGGLTTAYAVSLIWMGEALALSKCPGIFCKGGTAVPEFDGSAAVAVVSLLASVCGLIYSRTKA